METWGIELWDQREIFETYTHNGIDFFDKCASFIKERIRIEQEYAKSLRRLVKHYQFKPKEDLPFTFQNSFKRFLQENDEFAGKKEVISEEMHNIILKEMHKISLTSRTERKKALHKLTELKEQLHHHHKGLLVTMRKYDHASEEAKIALTNYETASQSLDHTKSQILKLQKASQDKGMLADKAREEYKASLDNYNGKQTLYYEAEMPGIISNEIQGAEEKRMEKFSAFLQEYAAIQQRNASITSNCIEGMIDAAKSCDPAKDSLILINRHKSGEIHPGDVEFDEFGTPHGRTMSLSHRHKPHKPSNKKEHLSNDNIAHDFADLPLDQRKEKINHAILSLEEQLSHLEKSKLGIHSEKLTGDIHTIHGQIDESEEIERIKLLLHQYQSYLSDVVDNYATSKKTNLNSVELEYPHAPTFESMISSEETQKWPTPPPQLPIPAPQIDEFDNDLECTVIYDFSGSHGGEMSVYAGEELLIVDEDDGSGWTKVAKGAAEGYIPTSYIKIH